MPNESVKRWQLTAPALEGFLRTLDPDRDRAALAYEALRERITGLFEWWGASRSAELADETLDRVARKLEQGATVPSGSLGAYVRGVARMVLYESRRDPTGPLIGDETIAAPEPDDSEVALGCLDRCLATLTDADRSLVLRYYGTGKTTEVRQNLARESGLSATALRIRTHRLRGRLEQCVTSCLQQR